jgi:hypothetical protein
MRGSSNLIEARQLIRKEVRTELCDNKEEINMTPETGSGATTTSVANPQQIGFRGRMISAFVVSNYYVRALTSYNLYFN